MDYVMYLDESGNTGNPRLKKNGWNFREQPNYGLGAICIKRSNEKEIKNKILNLFAKYDKELGQGKELKSTTDYWFNNELFCELIELLERHNTIFYFDIISKRFNIVKYLVHYCLYPDSIINFDHSIREEKVNFATLVSNNIEDESLQEFIELCQLETAYEGLRVKYIEFLTNLKNNVTEDSIVNRIEKGISIFKDNEVPLEKLLPIEDYTNKGRLMRLLPNIDSFNNVFVSVARLRLSPSDNVILYHDIQEQFGKSYERWISETFKMGLKNIKKIEFLKSDESILIQAIDFLVGNLVSLYQRTIINNSLTRNDRQLGKRVNRLIYNTNIVSTKYDQEKFFSSHGIKYGKTTIPK
ncbi:DUF3800 domain-containing protein [Sporosalibacterium faouarense]|uniref:DUF3800 domain-containing protein n=1 Tax=Sporosalibacterium faouarense TaxID=516123 RepID=UPI00192AE871|nr:DUF3800 domain-containing protein [Sporosalibacterium faouarense]